MSYCSARAICARCRAVVIENGATITVVGGLVPVPPFVACSECLDSLLRWLSAGPTGLPADYDPPGDWPPRVGSAEPLASA